MVPQNFPGWVLYSGLFEVGLIAVFAEEGPKKEWVLSMEVSSWVYSRGSLSM